MSNNDVTEIHATLKNIGVTAAPEQIEKKLKTLARFNVTGFDADVKEDGKWVTLKVKVVQIWDNTSDKITQTGLIGDETGIIKFTICDQPVQRKVPGYPVRFGIDQEMP